MKNTETMTSKSTLTNWLRKVRRVVNTEAGKKTSYAGRSNQTKDGSIHYFVDWRTSEKVARAAVDALNGMYRKSFTYLTSTHQIKVS